MTPVALKAWRTMLGLNQELAAKEIGVSRTQYSNYERGAASIGEWVEKATQLTALNKAQVTQKVDGRFRKPLNRDLEYGKPIFVYDGRAQGREVGYDPQGNPKDPSGRLRAKDEATVREFMQPFAPVGDIQERPNGWHVAIRGAELPPE